MSERIKILSYNIHKGKAFFSRRKSWHQLSSLLNYVQPDIVFLQEFLMGPEAESLLEKMADHLWPHHSFGQNATTGKNFDYGNAIISKFPIEETYNTNITNNNLEKRGLLYAKVNTSPQKNLHLFCSHLDLLKKSRLKQIDKIEDVFKKQVGLNEALIFAGDFNDWNNHLDPILREKLRLKEASLQLKGEFLPSFPSLLPMVSLDRIYYRGLEPLHVEVLKHYPLRMGSDHLPMVVEFK